MDRAPVGVLPVAAAPDQGAIDIWPFAGRCGPSARSGFRLCWGTRYSDNDASTRHLARLHLTASIKGFAARLPSLTIDLKGNRTRQVTLTVTDNSGSSTSVTQMVQLL